MGVQVLSGVIGKVLTCGHNTNQRVLIRKSRWQLQIIISLVEHAHRLGHRGSLLAFRLRRRTRCSARARHRTGTRHDVPIILQLLLGDLLGLLLWHEVAPHALALQLHIVEAGRPVAKVLLGVIEHLACLGRVLEGRRPGVARHDGRVVEQVDEAARVARQHDLLLGPLDGGGRVDVVGLLELPAGLEDEAQRSTCDNAKGMGWALV